MRVLLLLLLILVPLSQATSWAAEWRLVNGFEYANDELASQLWRANADAHAVSQVSHRTERGRKALRLTCDFTDSDERAYWDRDTNLDLSRLGRFRFWLDVQNSAVIRQGTIYFRSGDGWFGAWFSVQEGEQWVALNKSNFISEGTPAGWTQIDGVRMSFWRAQEGQATVGLDELEGIADEIVVVRGNLSQLAGSSEWRSVQRFSEQMVRNLEQLGIAFGVLDDTDVETGALNACRLAIFPYNPHISPEETEAIAQFIRKGGKVLFFYHLPEPIQPLLGIAETTWQTKEYEGQFATVHFQPSLQGLPDAIVQDSWNARVPDVENASVLGEWVDSDGEPTGIAAVTLHANGAFMGHVLLANGIAAKQRMLLALLSELLADEREVLLQSVLAHMGGVGYLPDFDTAHEFIKFHAQQVPNPQRKATLHSLGKAKEAHKKTRKALKKGDLDTAFSWLDTFHGQLNDAFYQSIPPRGQEFRAVWCHAPYGIPGWSWDDAIAQLAQNGFTAVVPNMLWGGLAYYPSDVLPVADEVKANGDAIAQCLEACRKHGLQIHVWKVNWNLQNAEQEFVAKLRQQGRLQADKSGQEVQWLCPSHPDNFILERDSLLEVVKNYPVDGIHFDYIRYPNQNGCYCAGCRERFQNASGLDIGQWPEDVITGEHHDPFGNWRREQITRLVKTVSQEARRLRTGVQISAAVFRDYPNCRETVGQDWVNWVHEGYLDFVCPMDYTSDLRQFRQWVAWQKEMVAEQIPLYPGIGASAPGLLPDQVVRQVHEARQVGVPGFIIFNYDLTVAEEHLSALRLGATK